MKDEQEKEKDQWYWQNNQQKYHDRNLPPKHQIRMEKLFLYIKQTNK